MNEPLFDIVCIAKNEQNTLPKLNASLKEYKARGGDICLLDTGSTDKTIELAKSFGFKVTEVGEKFIQVVDKDTADRINKGFVMGGEGDIVEAGNKLFNFSAARNYISSLAAKDFIITLDADEEYVNFDIDKLNELIKQGYKSFEYQFIYAFDNYGNPAIQFTQSKAFDRRVMTWRNYVHEILCPIKQGDIKRIALPEETILLAHHQEPGKEHRGNYLVGLSLDCYQNQNEDRQSHYLGRELMYTGRPRSAIKELKRHVEMNKWPAERAQSCIFIGDCFGMLNEPEKQFEWYNRAIYIDSNRREAFIKLAHFYQANNQLQAAICYAQAALQIPFTPYYANNMAHYREEPHKILYFCYGWVGRIDKAQEHLMKALDYDPYNPRILDDTKYYFEYPDQKIQGYMSFKGETFLYEMSKKMSSVLELGSWKGRSTHVICSGCKGRVTAIDTFKGSDDPKDWTHGVQDDSVYNEFLENTKKFDNLEVIKGDMNEVKVKDNFDMVFIDGNHKYEAIRKDIKKWKGKAKILLCGHDYTDIFQGVKQAVNEELGGPDGVEGTIWYKWVQKPLVSICVPTLGRPEKLDRLLRLIKENAGYDNYEVLVGKDDFPPNNLGVPKMLKKLVAKSKGELVMYLGNDCVPQKDFLQLAVFSFVRNFPDGIGLCSLNDGYWRGEMATHFIASKNLL